MTILKNAAVGFALTGSFCTIPKALEMLKILVVNCKTVIPIMSASAYGTDTRFGSAESIRTEIEKLCGNPVIHSVKDAEPLGPKKMLDLLVILPCTGNTAAKLCHAITDTAVTMAAKSHMRNNRPVLLGIATNDALSGSAQNIGRLLNTANIYFIPMAQDDPAKKPRSVIADFELLIPAAEAALEGRQLQPIIKSV